MTFKRDQEDIGHRTDAQTVAARIRATRRRMRLTLDRLAARAQLDKGYLSRVERGQKAPSIGTLLRVAEALNVQIGYLFGEKTQPDGISVIRRNCHQRFSGKRDASTIVFDAVLPADGARRLSAFIALPGPNANAKLVDHPGDELVYVLRGTVRLKFVDRVISLKAGDCAHFDGHLKHQLQRIGERPAEVLIVIGQDLPAATKAGVAKPPAHTAHRPFGPLRFNTRTRSRRCSPTAFLFSPVAAHNDRSGVRVDSSPATPRAVIPVHESLGTGNPQVHHGHLHDISLLVGRLLAIPMLGPRSNGCRICGIRLLAGERCGRQGVDKYRRTSSRDDGDGDQKANHMLHKLLHSGIVQIGVLRWVFTSFIPA